MEENVNEHGLLFKEFIKKHLQRETELENMIKDLHDKLNYLNVENALFEKILESCEISQESHGYTLAVRDIHLTDDEMSFVYRKRREIDEIYNYSRLSYKDKDVSHINSTGFETWKKPAPICGTDINEADVHHHMDIPFVPIDRTRMRTYQVNDDKRWFF